MAFDDDQRKALKAKLSYRHVKTRSSQGNTLSYIEGWHSIAEANRIFGHDSWDRQTQSPRCVWTERSRGEIICFYSTKVRITVRAGDTLTIREGIGTGFGRSLSPEMAHEIALKAAETDATKRALATFGNPFGLALYDKEQAQVTKPGTQLGATQRGKSQLAASVSDEVPSNPLVLRSGTAAGDHDIAATDHRERTFESADDYVAAALRQILGLQTLAELYAFWEINKAAFSALKSKAGHGHPDPALAIVSALKGRARVLGEGATESGPIDHPAQSKRGPNSQKMLAGPDKEPAPAGQLAFPKEKRFRDRNHLMFVAGQPCLVCGRKPTQAHHLRFTQPRAMSMKVSDEYTVPLCNTHHDSLHRTGDERAWWARHGILDPVKFAGRLWAASRMSAPLDDDEHPGGAEASTDDSTPPSHPAGGS